MDADLADSTSVHSSFLLAVERRAIQVTIIEICAERPGSQWTKEFITSELISSLSYSGECYYCKKFVFCLSDNCMKLGDLRFKSELRQGCLLLCRGTATLTTIGNYSRHSRLRIRYTLLRQRYDGAPVDVQQA